MSDLDGLDEVTRLRADLAAMQLRWESALNAMPLAIEYDAPGDVYVVRLAPAALEALRSESGSGYYDSVPPGFHVREDADGERLVRNRATYRHGTDISLRCNQCGTCWPFADDAPTQCPDCLDHLGEPDE